MTSTPPFKVGQPVWVRTHFTDLYTKYSRGARGVIVAEGTYFPKSWNVLCHGKTLVCVEHRETPFVDLPYIKPRPTLMWTVREWFMSLVGKK